MSKRPAIGAACQSNDAAPKRARELPPSETTIDDLPDEMLARVFQQFSCWDLLDLEKVCRRWMRVVTRYGWPNVVEIAIPDYHSKDIREYKRLMERCSSYLRWVTLMPRASDKQHLALLRRCPNIGHLLFPYSTDPLQLAGIIRELHADKLKSLSLSASFNDGAPAVEQMAALNELFGVATNSLELLRFTGPSLAGNEMRFPEGLRCLQLSTRMPYSDQKEARQFLSQLSRGRRFPHLHSLDMGMVLGEHVPLISSLAHLPQLEHLTLQNGWGADKAAIEQLSHALDHLASLRSLQITGGSALLEAVSRKCPQLEHLEWASSAHPSVQAGSQGTKALQAMGESLKRLRSLEVSGFQWPENFSWEGLEALLESGRLEYINLRPALPARLFYAAIEKNPRLQVISVDGHYSVVEIVKAAEDAQASNRGEPLPTIYCNVLMQTADVLMQAADVLMQKPGEERRGRVVFRDRPHWNGPKSHVLQQYRYGCLSDGKPRWGER